MARKLQSAIYEVRTLGDPLDAGNPGARACTIGGVAKSGTPYTIASEYICSRLGLLIGLPVPPGVIVRESAGSNNPAYISLRFGKRGERPPPVIWDQLVEDYPDLAFGIVAFDCWIANEDRHDYNLAYSRGVIDPVVFDHDQAFFGRAGPRADTLVTRQDETVANGPLCHMLSVNTPVQPFVERIAAVHSDVIRELCEPVKGIGVPGGECDAMVSFLLHRQTRIQLLLSKAPCVQQGALL